MAAQQSTPASLFPFPSFSSPNAPQGPTVPYDYSHWPQRSSQPIPQQLPYFSFQPLPNDTAQFQAPARNPQLQPQRPIPRQPPHQASDFVASEHGDPPIVPELPTINDLATLNTLPSFLYISLLLFLPFFYRARVSQVFLGVSLTEKEITSRYVGGPTTGPWRPRYWDEVKRSWSDFIDSTIKEWRTLNIVSALSLAAIYNVLQLGGSASGLVQCTALMSLVSALMSLIFGCLYIIRFETMRRPHKAMQWAQTALSPRNPWWNVFILLALPFVWLAWSLILFVICLMAVVWQTSGHTTNVHGLSSLSFQIKAIVSVLFFIGVLHLSLILYTFSGYDDIDKAWSKRSRELLQSAAVDKQYHHGLPWGAGGYLYEQPAAFQNHVYQFAPPAAPAQQGQPPETQPTLPPQQPDRPPSTLDIPLSQSLPRHPPAQPTPPNPSQTYVVDEYGSDTSPFVPNMPSPSMSRTSHRGRYDNRYLSAHYTPPPQSSRRPHPFSTAEGQRPFSSFEPRRHSHHPSRGQGGPSSHPSINDLSVHRTPMVFNLPEETISVDAVSPSPSSDNHSILQRSEMPIQYRAEPDGQSSATPASLPPISIDIPVRGAWGWISPGTRHLDSAPGSSLSSRRGTPSPRRNLLEDPNIGTSERLRPADLPSSSAITRSTSLPTTFVRRRGSRSGPEFRQRSSTTSSTQVQSPQTTPSLPPFTFPQPHPSMLMSHIKLPSGEPSTILQDRTGSAQPANPPPPDLSPLHFSTLPQLVPPVATPPALPSPSHFREGAGGEPYNTDPIILPSTPPPSIVQLSPIEEAQESSSPERRSSIRLSLGTIGRTTSEDQSQRRYSEYTNEASVPGDSLDTSHRILSSSNSPGIRRAPTPAIIDPLLPHRLDVRHGSPSDELSTGPATSQASLGLTILHPPIPRLPASDPFSDSVEFPGFSRASTAVDPVPVPTAEGRDRSSRRRTPSPQRDHDDDGDRNRDSTIRTRGIPRTRPLSFAGDIVFGSGSNSTATINTITSSTMATAGSHSPPRLESVTENTENLPTPIGNHSFESRHALSALGLNLVTPRGDEPGGVEIDGGGIVDSDSSSETSLHTAPVNFDSESRKEGEPSRLGA